MSYADWKAVSTQLARRSGKWREISNADRVLWLHLLLLSDSHGCVEGGVTAIWGLATEQLGWSRQQTDRSLRSLHEAKLIVHWEDNGTYHTEILGYDENQPGESLRRRGKRKSPSPPTKNMPFAGNSGVSPELVRSKVGVCSDTDIDRDVDIDIDINRNYLPSVDNYSPRQDAEADDLREQVKQIFEHWASVDAETTDGATRPRVLTAHRRRLIAARLREGYTAEQIQQAITYYCNDPWHTGDNPRGKRYTGLSTLLKSGEKIEAGLQLDQPTRMEKKYEAYADDNLSGITL